MCRSAREPVSSQSERKPQSENKDGVAVPKMPMARTNRAVCVIGVLYLSAYENVSLAAARGEVARPATTEMIKEKSSNKDARLVAVYFAISFRIGTSAGKRS